MIDIQYQRNWLGSSICFLAAKVADHWSSVRLKVTTKYWSEMRQATEIKQETRHINSSGTVMLHGRKGDSTGLEPFLGLENGQSASHCGVSLDADALSVRPSLSRHLTGKPAITESRSRLRRASLPLSKSFSEEARSALPASCVFSDVAPASMDAVASRAKSDNRQNRYPIALRPRDGVTTRIFRQPGAPRGLGFHTLHNVTARLSDPGGPEISCCGNAVSQLN